MKPWLAAAILLAAVSTARAGERYSVVDQGVFVMGQGEGAPADRYGWRSYQLQYDFELEQGGRRVARGSHLLLTLVKQDGERWTYQCRPSSGGRSMRVEVQSFYQDTLAVTAECRIPPRRFAQASGEEPGKDEAPVVLFQVIVQGLAARPGFKKGIYFLSAWEELDSPFSRTMQMSGDISLMGVGFASLLHPAQIAAARLPR